MNHGKEKFILALLVGLAAMAITLFLLSTPSTWAATLTASSTADSGSGTLEKYEWITSDTLGDRFSYVAMSDPSTAPRPSASGSSLCATTDFTYPLTIAPAIRDTFGPRLLLPQGYSRYDFHRGIDWPALTGTVVYAVAEGIVRSSRDDWPTNTLGSGKFVHLYHEDIGCETRYNHLSKVYVEEGNPISTGQPIGEVGSTGAMYPHLHFEVRQGQNVTQREAIHPLSTPFLPPRDTVTPTVVVSGIYTDSTGLTALVEVTSTHTDPDVTAVSVDVSGADADSRTIDYVDLNANTAVVADLDDPLVNDVCIIPADLNEANGYHVTMAFRRLKYDLPATVTARATDVDGWYATDTGILTGGLEVTPPEQVARGVPSQTVTFVYTLTNHTGVSDIFTLTHMSAQGWPAVVTPETATLGSVPITATVVITLSTNRFGPPDCGLLIVEAQNDTQRVAAGFYRIYRDAYVRDANGSDTPGAGSMITPFKTIGYAITQTDAGGTIYVAQGTYTENLILTKTIDLLGGYTTDWTARSLLAYSTIITGGGNDTVLEMDGDHGPLIEGFTFINGHRHGGAGGGVRLVGGAAPTLRSNWVLSNMADKSGGGIYIGPSGTLSPTIISNTIAGNKSNGSSGGGICVEDRLALIQGNDIVGNEAANYGGGIYITSSLALIQGNTISGNQAISKDGGGIYLTGDTTAQVLGNRILGNEAADDGGGVLVRSSGVCLVNNLIRDNTAGDDGSGIRVAGYSTPRIYHNTLVGNHPESGAGLYIGSDSTPVVINNIIAGHDVGVHCSSPVTVSFSVLSNTTNLDRSCIGFSNIIADPHLSDEVHLAPDSPAINRGREDIGVGDDIDGDLRLGVPDIGADEYVRYLYLPLMMKTHSP